MVDVHNLYYRLISYFKTILTLGLNYYSNDANLSNLISPVNTRFIYEKNFGIEQLNEKSEEAKEKYYLLIKSKLTLDTIKYVRKLLTDKTFKLKFEDDNYMFVEKIRTQKK